MKFAAGSMPFLRTGQATYTSKPVIAADKRADPKRPSFSGAAHGHTMPLFDVVSSLFATGAVSRYLSGPNSNGFSSEIISINTNQGLSAKCNQTGSNISCEVRGITPEQVRAGTVRFDAIVDVREPEEVKRGAIPGARNYPLGCIVRDIDDQQSALRSYLCDKDNVLLYCRSGYRSQIAAETIKKHIPKCGLYNLEGGFLSWNGQDCNN